MSPAEGRKEPDQRLRSKVVVMLTDAEFESFKELSKETRQPMSEILRELLKKEYPKYFKAK